VDQKLITPEFLYPIAIWPVLMTSILYTLFRYNKALQAQGVEVFALYKGLGAIFLIFYPLAAISDTAMHVYMFYKMGWKYLLCIPVVLIAMVVMFYVVGVTPYAQYVYPVVYVFLGLAFLDLIDVIYLKPTNAFNMWLLEHAWWKPVMGGRS